MRKTTGISLILLIFLSLCLLTFSLLSLSEASADDRLSKKAAARTAQYYTSVSTANAIVAAIDQILAENLAKSHHLVSAASSSAAPSSETDTASSQIWMELNAQIPNQTVFKELFDLPDPVFYDASVLQFSVAVTEDQKLHVAMQLQYPKQDSDVMYEIIEWKIINTQDWNADRSQNLLRLDSPLFSEDS